MDGLFWVTGAVKEEPAIDAWLEAQVPELGGIARAWFARMRACGEDVRELIHDGCPVACVDDVPFGYVNVFRAHVNVGFSLARTCPTPGDCCRAVGSGCAT